jgi:hypothetical protein
MSVIIKVPDSSIENTLYHCPPDEVSVLFEVLSNPGVMLVIGLTAFFLSLLNLISIILAVRHNRDHDVNHNNKSNYKDLE